MNKVTNKLIPELRFPEFVNEGEWAEKELEKFCFNISSGKDKNTIEGEFELYGSTGIIGKSENASYEGDFILVARVGANAGLLNRAKGKFGVTDNTLVIDLKNVDFIEFLFYSLEKVNLNKLVFGSGQPLITGGQLKSLKLLIPKSENEQQKIASCLSSLDEVIAAHSQKLDALKTHKKGLMQNLFPQMSELGLDRLKDDRMKTESEILKSFNHKTSELGLKDDRIQSSSESEILKSSNPKNHNSDNVPKWRFPEFVKDEEWVEKTLDEVATFLKGKGISKSDIVENGSLPCIRYGELYTHYKETIRIIKSYTNLSADDLVLSQANDVIIPASGETQIDIATASCVLEKGIALGGDLNIIRTKINGVFLSYFMNNTKKKEIAQMAQGISVVHLYPSQLKILMINIPKSKEQQKIASCLSSLDVLITAQAEKIEQLKWHKKGLMQGLFPITN